MADTDTVLLTFEGGVATLTLNRPEALNAIDEPMAAAMQQAVARVAADAAVRCLVIRGAGAHFTAGGDVKTFVETVRTLPPADCAAAFEQLIRYVHGGVLQLRRLPIPIVAAVRGAVAGGGFSLMLAADLVIAAADARFTLAYCHIGTTPDGGSTWQLPRLIGLRRAAELVLLGDRFDAATAERLGLVNRVVAPEALDAEAAALAARLAAGPTLAHAKAKALLQHSFERDLAAQLDAETESFVASVLTRDFAEGVEAFAAKRPPRFEGK